MADTGLCSSSWFNIEGTRCISSISGAEGREKKEGRKVNRTAVVQGAIARVRVINCGVNEKYFLFIPTHG